MMKLGKEQPVIFVVTVHVGGTNVTVLASKNTFFPYYFRKFIQGYSSMVACLTQLMQGH
jgi:hypothetical protein